MSNEGQFAFTRPVEEFCKEVGRIGWFKIKYRFNFKEQMEKRDLFKARRKHLKLSSLCWLGEVRWEG